MSDFVDLLYNPDWTQLVWARKHCPSYITNDIVVSKPSGDFYIRYYFSNKNDALIFRIRWSE